MLIIYLQVKVDAKTKTLLEEYKEKKKSSNKEEKEEGETTDDVDEFSQREDRVAKAGLDAIMREYARDLNKEPEPSAKPEEKKEDPKKKDLKEKDKKKADQVRSIDGLQVNMFFIANLGCTCFC